MSRRHLLTSAFGTRWSMDDSPDGLSFVAQTDVAPILELNKAMATHNDGYTPDRTMRRVASVPLAVMHHWKETEGWDPWNTSDPDVRKQWAKKLDDPDFALFRTAPGRVGDSWRKGAM